MLMFDFSLGHAVTNYFRMARLSIGNTMASRGKSGTSTLPMPVYPLRQYDKYGHGYLGFLYLASTLIGLG